MKALIVLFTAATLQGCSMFSSVDEKDYARYLSERDAAVAECKRRYPTADCIVVVGALPFMKE